MASASGEGRGRARDAMGTGTRETCFKRRWCADFSSSVASRGNLETSFGTYFGSCCGYVQRDFELSPILMRRLGKDPVD